MAFLEAMPTKIEVKNTFIELSPSQPPELRRSLTAPADVAANDSVLIVPTTLADCSVEQSPLSRHFDGPPACSVDSSQSLGVRTAERSGLERSPMSRYFDGSPSCATASGFALQTQAFEASLNQQLGMAFFPVVPLCQLQPASMMEDARCTPLSANHFIPAPCIEPANEFAQQWAMSEAGLLGPSVAHTAQQCALAGPELGAHHSHYTSTWPMQGSANKKCDIQKYQACGSKVPKVAGKAQAEGPKAVFVDLSKLRPAKP